MKPSSRKRLRRSVRSSYKLIERILALKSPRDSFVTSNWAALEAIGSVKRSRIQFNMLTENISFAYYDDVKDQKGFRLQNHQILEINRLITLLHKSRAKLPWSNLQWSRLPIVFDDVVFFITIGLDSPDAVHAGIARSESCNIFVTRDRDFLKRKKTLKPYFEVVEPHLALKRLSRTRPARATLAQQGA
jgi:predicted nucleic acid-binding protein